MDARADYDPFAWVYNQHWGRDYSQRVFPVVQSLVLNKLQKSGLILDLACGTGQLARLINDDGYQVIGVDRSEKMLDYARQNAPNSQFIESDLRSFEIEARPLAALSVYDSLNHLMNQDDLRLVFSQIYKSLGKPGLFLFDLNLESGFQARWNGSFHILKADHAVLVEAQYDEATKTGNVDITLFTKEINHWSRTNLSLEEACYSAEEVTKLIDQAGFRKLTILDAETDLHMKGETGRAIFLAEK